MPSVLQARRRPSAVPDFSLICLFLLAKTSGGGLAGAPVGGVEVARS